MSDTVKEFAAGAFGGLVGLVVGHPCDTMKTVTQNSAAGQTPGMRQLGRHMTSLGAATFFRGLSVPLWSYAVVNSVFFGVHKNLGKAMGLQDEATDPSMNGWYHLPASVYASLVITGGMAGAVQLIPSVPVEVIKVRMQKDAHIQGPRPLVSTTIRQIYRERGFRGFFRGWDAQFLRDVPASACYFCTYEACRRLLRRNFDWSESMTSLVAGALGGWVSWILPLPQDVIKTRLQSGREKNIRSCLRAMRAEGPHAFFAGLGLVSIRALLVNAVTFWGYEVAIRRLNDGPGETAETETGVEVVVAAGARSDD